MRSPASGKSRLLAAAVAGTTLTTPLAGQVRTPDFPRAVPVILRTADDMRLTLSRSPLDIDGERCVPLTDLAMAIHGSADLAPSLALSGTVLRATGAGRALREDNAPGRGFLVIRRNGLISDRVRSGVDLDGLPQQCVPATDLARSMGGTLKSGTSIEGFDAQINSMMNNNLAFLAVQTKVQNVSQTTQLLSNIAKADHDAKLNSIRNIRTALFEETEAAMVGMPPDEVAWARSFASNRGYLATRTEIEAAIHTAFPDASPEERIKIHMILLQILMGDIIGALRSYAVLMDEDMRHLSRQIVQKLDRIQEARSQVIRNFARHKPPRAYAGGDPQSAARAQDKSQRYTQFVQMSTQLMNELQSTERELVDALQTMQRELDNLWQAYASMRDEDFRTNERIMRNQ
ncbi:MAG TPA: hypothetical protein VJP59_05320 [Gemmatimonadota bacterium]|nr:hypothetical protein [Gemmatimonadota bacterium]